MEQHGGHCSALYLAELAEVAQCLCVVGGHPVYLTILEQCRLQPPHPPQAACHHQRPLALQVEQYAAATGLELGSGMLE